MAMMKKIILDVTAETLQGGIIVAVCRPRGLEARAGDQRKGEVAPRLNSIFHVF